MSTRVKSIYDESLRLLYPVTTKEETVRMVIPTHEGQRNSSVNGRREFNLEIKETL